jgi:hypothetical protein
VAGSVPDRTPDHEPVLASPVAYLRVYEPLAAFPADERAHWESYAASGTQPSRAGADGQERRHALASTIRPVLDPGPDGAFFQRVDGLLLVCPWARQPRIWEAVKEFRAGLPGRVADAFIPPVLAEHAVAEWEKLRVTQPDWRAHVRSATWVVPLPWFVPFEPAERLLVLDTPGGGSRSLTYSTSMGAARRRVGRAIGVLRRSFPDAPTVEALEALGRWLEEFHPHSRLELDYGSIVDVLDDDALREDSSAADVGESIAALQAADGALAGAAYERILHRWRVMQLREQAN